MNTNEEAKEKEERTVINQSPFTLIGNITFISINLIFNI